MAEGAPKQHPARADAEHRPERTWTAADRVCGGPIRHSSGIQAIRSNMKAPHDRRGFTFDGL